MDIYPLLLVALSSILHLGWNTVVKQSADKLVTLWVAVSVQTVIGLTVYCAFFGLPDIPMIGLVLVILSGFIHALYSVFLTRSYHYADLSVVYPVSRGLGTFFVVCGGVMLLGNAVSLAGFLGISIILLAIFLEPTVAYRHNSASLLSRKAAVFMIGTGAMIGTYLTMDSVGVQYMSPWLYLILMQSVVSLSIFPFIVRKSKAVLSVAVKPGLQGAVFMFGSYGLTLMAMQMEAIAYVASARSVGIIVSGVVGYYVLKEALSTPRIASILLIALGIILIGLA